MAEVYMKYEYDTDTKDDVSMDNKDFDLKGVFNDLKLPPLTDALQNSVKSALNLPDLNDTTIVKLENPEPVLKSENCQLHSASEFLQPVSELPQPVPENPQPVPENPQLIPECPPPKRQRRALSYSEKRKILYLLKDNPELKIREVARAYGKIADINNH